MTKEQYYEMCEQLGTDPLDSETPVDLTDLPLEVQRAFSIYRILPEIIDTMSGHYGGKDLNCVAPFMSIKGVDNQDIVLDFITYINLQYILLVNKKKNNNS